MRGSSDNRKTQPRFGLLDEGSRWRFGLHGIRAGRLLTLVDFGDSIRLGHDVEEVEEPRTGPSESSVEERLRFAVGWRSRGFSSLTCSCFAVGRRSRALLDGGAVKEGRHREGAQSGRERGREP